MNDKELYRQKKQAQLDEWRAELDRLKAKTAAADADVKLELNKEIDSLESKIEEGKAKLAELAAASDEAWGSIKSGMESAWDDLAAAFGKAADRFKK